MSKFENFKSRLSSMAFEKGLPILEISSKNVVENIFSETQEKTEQNIKTTEDSIIEMHENVDAQNKMYDTEIKINNIEYKDDENYLRCLNSIQNSLNEFCNNMSSRIDEFTNLSIEILLLASKSIAEENFENIDGYKKLIEKISHSLKKVEKQYSITIKVNRVHEKKISKDFSSNRYLTNNLQYKIVFDDNLAEYDSIIEWENGRVEDILQHKINTLKSLITETLRGVK